MSIISESGLYSLILGSRKPEARAFKRWITHEVIPSIRKHGAYMTDSLLDALEAHPEAVPEYLNRLRSENARNRGLTRRLRLALPKRSITTPLLTLRTAPISAPPPRSWAFPKSSLPGIWRKRSICFGTRTASSFPVRSKKERRSVSGEGLLHRARQAGTLYPHHPGGQAAFSGENG